MIARWSHRWSLIAKARAAADFERKRADIERLLREEQEPTPPVLDLVALSYSFEGQQPPPLVDSNPEDIDELLRPALAADLQVEQGLEVTRVEVAGSYASGMGDDAAQQRRPGQRMIAAIVNTATGPYYLKFFGDDEVVTKNRAAFDGLLRSIQPSGS